MTYPASTSNSGASLNSAAEGTPSAPDVSSLPRAPMFMHKVSNPAEAAAMLKAGLGGLDLNNGLNGGGLVKNQTGLFDVSEDLKKEQERMDGMKLANPEKALKIFESYNNMVTKSVKGDLNGVLALMAMTGNGPPPAWFAVKMFKESVMGLQLEIPR